MNKRVTVPEPHFRDVAATLLHLAPSDRRAAIRPLIAMIERVASGGELHHPDDLAIPVSPCLKGDLCESTALANDQVAWD
jgi:hypothetical protein